ncbi:MAG: clan AA aspartic protease [Gemmataceae bacterium]
MITGTVNSRHEILIRLPVRNAAGSEQEVEAILDTGFNGSLTLPPALTVSLGLTWVTRGSAILANGTVEQFDVYAATVLWDGIPQSIMVPAIHTAPLLGMALLTGYDLRVRVAVGGLVQIEAIP